MAPRPATCRGRRALGAAVLLPLLSLLFAGFSEGAPGGDSAKRKPKRRARPPAAPTAPTVPRAEQVNLRRFFGDSSGTFVLLDGKSGRRRVYNPQQAARRFTPYSTFKIPNTLIALDTGVADGPDFGLAWDRTKAPAEDWWPKTWARDHRLRTALRDSVVWFYQELARRVGPQRMEEHVRRFGYGNMDLSGGIDQFWLRGGLRISADEQVDFLRRIHRGEVGVSERSTAVLKEILVLEDCPAFRLSGKSGTGPAGSSGSDSVDDPIEVGW
ncbi:MAG TPA: penicillin-binding transpeptidase domain-containing protein, partial [Thermoanaerobaculia bacterium]|nr:penicillin-binding transpeptidase domain-containing protein [Thermoanaerobaculia bacterium]